MINLIRFLTLLLLFERHCYNGNRFYTDKVNSFSEECVCKGLGAGVKK